MARFSRFRLQQLEARDCPSVTVQTSENGHTLSIVGDQTAESISIVQSDATNSLEVSVSPSGQTAAPTLYQFASSSIRTIRIDMDGGNDTLSYSLNGENLTYAKDIHLNTGSGNVSANFDFATGSVSIENDLSVEVTGGKGQDSIQAELGDVTHGAQVSFLAALGAGKDSANVALLGNLSSGTSTNIDLEGGKGADDLSVTAANVAFSNGAELAVSEAGGKGKDQLSFSYSGEMDGLLTARLKGGPGADTVNATIAEAYDSSGSSYAWVDGGPGNDTLTLSMSNLLPVGDQQASSSEHQAGWINGGKGTNTAYCTPQVQVKNCEKLDPLAVAG